MISEPNDNPETLEAEPVVEPVETEVPIAADNSVSEDEVLDRLLGIDSPEPRRDVSTPKTSAPQDSDFDRAVKALQRDGVPAEVIESFKADPSKLKDWGLKAAKRQADVDSFGAKVAEERKAKPTAQETAKEVKASASSDDNEADADPLSQFGEIFGDEATKPIRNITEKLRNEFDQRTRLLEVKYETQLAYDRMSRDYGKDVPSLDDISEQAARISRERPGEFESVSDIIREAFRQSVGEPKRLDPRNSARPTIGKTPPRPVRQIDKDDVVLDILLSGGSKADAMRAANR
jgi:hypothetical protein